MKENHHKRMLLVTALCGCLLFAGGFGWGLILILILAIIFVRMMKKR